MTHFSVTCLACPKIQTVNGKDPTMDLTTGYRKENIRNSRGTREVMPEFHSLLVVEDDKGHIDIIRRVFETTAGVVNLHFARTIEDAKKCIELHPPDLVIADWLLPDGKGAELIAGDANPTRIPVLMMTSHGNEQLAVEIIKTGAIDYIVKSGSTLMSLPHIARSAWLEWQATETRKRLDSAMEKQYALLEAIIESQDTPIFSVDTGYRYISFNKSHAMVMKALYGADIEIGQSLLDYQTVPADRNTSKSNIDRAIAGEKVIAEAYSGDESFCRSYFRVYHFPIRLGQGSIIGVVIFAIDNTEQKKSEIALQVSAVKYRTLIESANEGIFIIQDGVIPYANPKALEIIGYDKENLQTFTFDEFIHPDDRDAAKERHQQRMAGIDLESTTILRIFDKSKNIHWLEINAVVIEWEGRPATLNFVTDVSARKKAENALIKSEAKYRKVIESIQDVFYRSDADGNLIMASPSWARLLGYDTVEECLGKNIAETFYLDPKERQAFVHKIYEKGLVSDYEVTLKRKEAPPIIVSVSSHLYYDKSGTVQGIEGIFRDITGKKQAEAALTESIREKDILLREIHHRVKNNLQVISSLLYLQANEVKDQDTKDILAACRNRIISMALLHENLFQVSNFSSVSMGPYIRNLVQYLEDSYDTRGLIHYTVDIPGTINLDIDTGIAVGMITTELVTNSIKYAFPPGSAGQVWIGLRRDNAGMHFWVNDNGKGLPEGFDPKISSGLGMKLVGGLVRQVHGTMEVQCNGGTTITIKFNSGIVDQQYQGHISGEKQR